MMLLAPLIRGGNRHMALIVLEWLGLIVIVLATWRSRLWVGQLTSGERLADPSALTRSEWMLITSPVIMAGLFLLPIPTSWWWWLPDREIYEVAPFQAMRPVTLTQDATVASLLSCIPIVAAFLWARTMSATHFKQIPIILLISALIQSVWGLLQVGPFKSLYFGAEFAGKAIGAFANANHFANYLTLCLPLAAHAITQNFGRQVKEESSGRHIVALLWTFVLLALAAGVLVSGSRTGTATFVIVAVLTTGYLYARSLRNVNWSRLLWGGFLLFCAAAVTAGIFVARLDANSLSGDVLLRWRQTSSSWLGVIAFWPIGAGPGSFSSVYPLFQPPNLGGTLDYVHNDYVQLLFETGVFGLLLIALVMWLAFRRLTSYPRDLVAPNAASSLSGCAGIGLIAIALHSLTDFNLHIPANAMLTACLFGTFLRRT